jgi:hypothetical protein
MGEVVPVRSSGCLCLIDGRGGLEMIAITDPWALLLHDGPE